MAELVVPHRIVWAREVPMLAWARIDRRALDAGFWYDTVRAGPVVSIGPLDTLIDEAPDIGVIGAIHHMSRCGSTLVARQITAVPGLFALSEPLIFHQLLDGPPADAALTRRRVRTLAALHRQALAPVAERIAIKWPLTMAHHASVLADAMPEVPALFLHRDPDRVMASIARAPLREPERPDAAARAMAPSIARTAGDPPRRPADPLERMAHMVASSCLSAAGAGGMARLDYAELPGATSDAILPAFGVRPDASAIARIERAAGPHSKDRASSTRFAERPLAMDQRVAACARTIVEPALAHVIDRLPPLVRA